MSILLSRKAMFNTILNIILLLLFTHFSSNAADDWQEEMPLSYEEIMKHKFNPLRIFNQMRIDRELYEAEARCIKAEKEYLDAQINHCKHEVLRTLKAFNIAQMRHDALAEEKKRMQLLNEGIGYFDPPLWNPFGRRTG